MHNGWGVDFKMGGGGGGGEHGGRAPLRTMQVPHPLNFDNIKKMAQNLSSMVLNYSKGYQ